MLDTEEEGKPARYKAREFLAMAGGKPIYEEA